MGYIYRITNTINNKIYIGQTKNYKKRFWEHKNSFQKEKRKDFYSKKNRAFRKYGIDNFKFEVIEEVDDSLLDSREEYWITYYDSFESGYNSTPGACSPPSLIREKHPMAKLSEEDVEHIVHLLQKTSLTFSQIGKIFGVSKGTVNLISLGQNWHSPNLDYPLRKDALSRKGSSNGNSKLTEEIVLQIREEYKTKSVSFLEEKYCHLASKSAIRKVLTGETYSHLPVYKKKQKRWI